MYKLNRIEKSDLEAFYAVRPQNRSTAPGACTGPQHVDKDSATNLLDAVTLELRASSVDSVAHDTEEQVSTNQTHTTMTDLLMLSLQ